MCNFRYSLKVPCKNFEFGCACMVRVRDRKRHEDASDLTRPRSCLWFGGPSALNRIALDEEVKTMGCTVYMCIGSFYLETVYR